MDTNMEDVGRAPEGLTSANIEPATIPTLDGWIESLMACKQLAEVDVQRLCEKVRFLSFAGRRDPFLMGPQGPCDGRGRGRVRPHFEKVVDMYPPSTGTRSSPRRVQRTTGRTYSRLTEAH